MFRSEAFWLALTLAGLGACAHQPLALNSAPTPAAPASLASGAGAAEPMLAALSPTVPAGPITTTWSGRFAATWRGARTDGSPDPREEEQRVSGQFRLREVRARPEGRDLVSLDVATPLGSTLARASTDDGGAQLDLADGRSFKAASAEDLTRKVLGWRIPVTRLPGWLHDAEGTPGDGWRVDIEERRGAHPSRVRLSWPADGLAAVTLLLLVDAPESERP